MKGKKIISKGKTIAFRLVEPIDAAFILSLRLEEKLNKYLSPVENSLEKQVKWIVDYKDREKDSLEYYFIVENNHGEAVGTLRLYDFKKNSFSWGSWIMNDKAPQKAAIESAILLYEYAFFTLGFTASHFEVRKDNIRVLSFHKRFGASIVSQDENNFYYSLSLEAYQATRDKYLKFIEI